MRKMARNGRHRMCWKLAATTKISVTHTGDMEMSPNLGNPVRVEELHTIENNDFISYGIYATNVIA